MTPDDIDFLKSKVDKDPVKIRFVDGEEITAKIVSVSEFEKDVIFEVISSNRNKEHYGKGAILARFDDVFSAG